VTDETQTRSTPACPDDDAAWAGLRARWDDPAAHRAFLSGCADLEALARAGARYRAALQERPDDAIAAAGRDEVLRKATVLGLSAVPRTTPPAPVSPWVKRGLLAVLAILLVGAVAWTALAFLRTGAVR
jgi:hypothetical protein